MCSTYEYVVCHLDFICTDKFELYGVSARTVQSGKAADNSIPRSTFGSHIFDFFGEIHSRIIS